MNEDSMKASVNDDLPDESELFLKPLINRPKTGPGSESKDLSHKPSAASRRSTAYRRNPHTSLYGVDASHIPLVNLSETGHESRTVRIRTSEAKQQSRTYANMKLLQATYRGLAYIAFAVGVVMLVLRIIGSIFSSHESFSPQAVEFFSYSFITIFLTLLTSAALLGAAELLQILVDVHTDWTMMSKSDQTVP